MGSRPPGQDQEGQEEERAASLVADACPVRDADTTVIEARGREMKRLSSGAGRLVRTMIGIPKGGK